MKKKFCITMIIAAVLIMQLAACGGKKASSSVAPTGSTSAKEQSSTAEAAQSSKAETAESSKEEPAQSSKADAAQSSKEESAQSSKAEAAQSSKAEAAQDSGAEAAQSIAAETSADEPDPQAGQDPPEQSAGDETDLETGEEPEEKTEEEIAAEDAEAESAFGIGGVEGSSYRNEFFGIAVNTDASWHFYKDSELQELNESAVEILNNETAREALSEGNTYFDMFAENLETIQSMNMTVAKVSAIERVMGTEAILNSARDALENELESQGLTNVSCSVGRSVFLGNEVPSIIIQADGNGFTVFEREVYLRRGAYAASLTVVSFQEDTTQDILDLFMPAA